MSSGEVLRLSKVPWLPARVSTSCCAWTASRGCSPAGHRHRLPGRALRALLHVAARIRCRASSRSSSRSWARCSAWCSPETCPAGLLLGADEPVFVPADRLLAPQRRRARRRAHGPHRHGGRRAVPPCRRADARAASSAATISTRCSPRATAIRAHALYLPALVLVLLGALTKSAQFPFHFWLPHAMAAPTPVSAYLHSATMVKLGVFLMARLWPVLSGTDAWFWIVGSAGMITLAARRLHRDVPARPEGLCSPIRRSATSA